MFKKIVWSFFLLCVLNTFATAQNHGYAPIIRNDLNISAYNWNAFETDFINMRALAMVGLDASHFYQDGINKLQVGDMSHYDRWDVRGLRIGAAGTINFDKAWTYLISGAINSLMRDYDNQSDEAFTLLDCLIGIPLWGEYGRLQIGKMKEPISMERTMGMIFEQVMERPMHLDALLPSRNIGITLSDLIWNERIRWRAGIFNDWLDKDHLSIRESNYQITGRITGILYENKENQQLVHLGAAYRYEKIKEGTVRYDVGPEFYFSKPWLDTGNIPAEYSDTLNLEFSYLDGPLWLASEYTATSLHTLSDEKLFFHGYHVALNYFITGEHRGYNKRTGNVRRITPVLDFDKGGWGAVELSARYSYMDLSDKDIEAGKMHIGSLGLIWHPRKDHQFHLQWSRAKLHQKILASDPVPLKSNTDMLQVRWVWVID